MNVLIALSVLAIVVLYLGLYKANNLLLPVTLGGLVIALGLAAREWNSFAQPIFNGMMVFDNFAVAFSVICILSTILILLLSKGYFEKISDHVAEYYTIMLFALTGIIVMVSYHNLTMLFVGVEIMSVSLYILAGIKKRDFASNEAALKYFLMGAFSTGFLLFGIALIYGSTTSFDIEFIKNWLTSSMSTPSSSVPPIFYAGVLLMAIGLAFKVGAAPFHFWTPDVYEGSPSLITAFMSTVVKTAGFAAFVRLFGTCFFPIHAFWMPVILVITVVTLFVGNITAIYQTSFKRMLGWSSIAHAGYMLFAVVTLGSDAAYSVFLYAMAYSTASIVAFAALILVRAQTGTDSFDGFNGLGKKNPFLAFCLTVAMLSLAGIPLTAGFIGKFVMFSNALLNMHTGLVILAAINAIISIFYYFRVIIAMYFKEADRNELAVPAAFKFVLAVSVVAILVVGIWPGFIPNLL